MYKIFIVFIFLTFNNFEVFASSKHQAGVFIGETSIDSVEEFTYGLEYEYRPYQNYGFGLTLENIQEAHDDIRVYVASFYYHPTSSLRFGIGFGSEKSTGHQSEDLTRLSLAYDFHISDNFSIAPTLSFDRVNNETAKVYGFSFNLLF